MTGPSTIDHSPSTIALNSPQPIASWFSAARIADALNCSKPTVINRARAEGWLSRQQGNRLEFIPPESVVAEVNGRSVPTRAGGPSASVQISVSFSTAALTEGARQRALLRQQAVLRFRELLRQGNPVELSLSTVCVECSLWETPIKCSPRSLRAWNAREKLFGLNGLVDQKQGRVGRKAAASYLTEDQINAGKAIGYEQRSVARAARELMARNDLHHGARQHLHGAHASKSYVSPSVRRMLSLSADAKDLLQGPRKQRLDGRHVVFDYSAVKAGDWWTSDDMTSNVICWMPFNNARGFILGQPQVLPILDIGSNRWLMVSVIMRPTMAYNADDIWGLFGDAFDQIGLPNRGFVLEHGSWASKRVIGQATGIHDDDRIGGLKSLGLEVIHAQLPTGKVEIEAAFHRLQCVVDACPGFIGREQRKDKPESMKAILREINNGTRHPREFFPELAQFTDHVKVSMQNLNHEVQEGKLLRGQSPLEKWAADAPVLTRITEEYRWLYRSAKDLVKVTRNGVKVTRGTGAAQQVYYWDNPELLVNWTGAQVIVMWNDRNPEADALILNASTRAFLGSAQRVDSLARFDAPADDFKQEKARQSAARTVARTEVRAIQPHLARGQRLVGSEAATQESNRIKAEFTQANERAEQVQTTRREISQEISRINLSAEDIAAAHERPANQLAMESGERVDLEEFSELFSD